MGCDVVGVPNYKKLSPPIRGKKVYLNASSTHLVELNCQLTAIAIVLAINHGYPLCNVAGDLNDYVSSYPQLYYYVLKTEIPECYVMQMCALSTK